MRTQIALLSLLASIAFAAPRTHWVVMWGASPAPQLASEGEMRSAKLTFDNQTLREIVHTSLGGNTVRVRLSNAYGKQAVEIGAAHIALRAADSGIAAGSDKALTFGGRTSAIIPPDAVVVSDPVQLDVPSNGDLAVSVFLPKAAVGAGIHYSALQTNYVGSGNLTAAPSIENGSTLTSWVFLAGVDVLAPEHASAIVAFGDSITDGARSTINANMRWPNILANRLAASHKQVGVLDAGIGGNRILHDSSNVRVGVNALARFDRDVLAQPGVKYVIILEGINDIGHPGAAAAESETVSAEEIIAGLKQMIERAHEKDIQVFGATLTPFEGTTIKGYFSPEKEVKRKAVNEWIRNGHAFDGVVDFEKATRDPANPDRMQAAYDGGDHLHPGDAGYKAMAESINLALFK